MVHAGDCKSLYMSVRVRSELPNLKEIIMDNNSIEEVEHKAVVLGDGTAQIQCRSGVLPVTNQKVSGITIIPKDSLEDGIIHIYSTTKKKY